MSTIVFIDTTVYLNRLNVPGRNQEYDSVKNDFQTMMACGTRFLLPCATIFETGNHISRLPDEKQRRKFAEAMVNDVRDALEGKSPYLPTQMLSTPNFIKWLNEFPDYVAQGKWGKKDKNEGGSLSDFTIKKEWEEACANSLNRNRRVRIWSLDSDLSSCDRNPEKGK